MLSPGSRLPLYQQLADDLRSKIEASVYPPGSRIPSEHELSKTYSVGRPTVRQATDLLVRRQLLDRRRGSGTFVLQPPKQVDLFSLGGTLASFEKGSVHPKTRLTQRLRLQATELSAHNPLSGRAAYSFERLSSVRGRPVLLERFWLDPAVFRDLHQFKLSGRSLSQLVETHYALKPLRAHQTFRVHVPNPALRRQLKTSADEPLLLVQRTLDFAKAPAAVFAELYGRTGEFLFSQTIGATPNA